MYTQQKPSWVMMRKKLTICLEEGERGEKLAIKEAEFSDPFLAILPSVPKGW